MTSSSPRAVVATGFGGPAVLALVEVERRRPGPGEVTIRVRAAAVNPFDHKVYSGAMGADASKLPMPLGLEVSGEVTDVGPDAVGPAGPVAVGDAVIGYPVTGGYASEVTVPAASVLPKPAAMTFGEAAGLLATGVTAVYALTVADVTRGDTLLVHGVSGGVGLTIAQIAVDGGVTVVGTASERSHALLRGYGVVPVTYGPGLAERVRTAAPAGLDAAIDAVGTDEAVDTSIELVGAARTVSLAAWGRAGTGITLLGGKGSTDLRAAARLPLVRRVEAGTLRVVVARTFPLAEAADAHRLVAGGHAGGKVVLLP